MTNSIKSMEDDFKKSQHKLKEAQHLAKIGSWKIDCNTEAMEWSEEVYKIHSLDPLTTKASYKNHLEAIPFHERESVINTFSAAKKSNKPCDIFHTLLTKDGSHKYVHEHIVVQHDESGNPLGLYGTIQDITEQKQTDEILRRTQKMDALGKLTGGVAHELNNLLGIVLGYSELILDNLNNEPNLEKNVKRIYRAGNRAKTLTQKLLAFSRKEPSTVWPTDINALLCSEQHILEKTLTPRINLVYKLSDNIWPVKIDKGALEYTILNISINAMHAIENLGSLTVSTSNIHMTTLDVINKNIAPGDYVLLSFSDTGKGMNEEVRNQLFDPFFTTKGDKGTGLGMAQVYGFIQQSNGAIHVFSEPDRGTRITIYLPRLHNSGILNPSKDTNNEQLHGHETILIVDDEEPLRELAKEILSESGYQVLCAEGGNAALDILKKEPVDLLLSDVIMPKMDGYQLASKVQTLFPKVKIQMASGFSAIQHKDTNNNELRKHQLQKPFTSNILLRRIRELLDE